MGFLIYNSVFSILTFFFICLTVKVNTQAVPFLNESSPTPAPTPVPLTSTIEPLVTKLTVGTLGDGINISSTPLPPQKPPPALGLDCTNSSQCKANFSSCINNICTCQDGYINSGENLRCLKVVTKLGDECSEDQQCSKGLSSSVGPTTCLNFICSCAIGMSLIEDKCQGPRVLKTTCTKDDDCLIKKSHCNEGMCLCHDGFVPNSENNLCLPLNFQLQQKSVGAFSCSEDVQCQDSMGDNAICVVGSSGAACECAPGTHQFKSNCIPYKDLGSSCSHDEECVSKDTNTESPNSRICNQNVCVCNVGWVKENNICIGGASQNTLAGALISALVLFWLLQKQ